MLDSNAHSAERPGQPLGPNASARMVSDLTGRLLIALPGLDDPRFARSLIYLVSHSADGAMGIVINKSSLTTSFDKLLSQLEIVPIADALRPEVLNGGPCESGHGFILHGDDYRSDSTLLIEPQIRLTRTLDILKAIAAGAGPAHCRIALGYAGWQPGQLEEELQGNSWLVIPATPQLLFQTAIDDLWDLALAQLGATPALLSTQTGRA